VDVTKLPTRPQAILQSGIEELGTNWCAPTEFEHPQTWAARESVEQCASDETAQANAGQGVSIAVDRCQQHVLDDRTGVDVVVWAFQLLHVARMSREVQIPREPTQNGPML
jgi:hypothetical protein